MPDLTGTSTGTLQTVMSRRAITAAQMQLLFTAQASSMPVRVGYGFVIAQPPATNTFARIVWQGDIQLPGLLFNPDTGLGFTAVHYLMIVRWNQPNLAWLLRYT